MDNQSLSNEDIEYIKKIAKKYGRKVSDPIKITDDLITQATSSILNDLSTSIDENLDL